MNNLKYKKQYFPVKNQNPKWINKENIEQAPIWCSVDLRDGNQALEKPMTMDLKIEFFKELVRIGFKEIEVGFPASNDIEYAFCRKLIEEKLIPDDVTIQVLTQARQHIIERTFEAICGCKNAIVHVYNSTSKVQREHVFKKTKDEVKQIAINGAKMVKHYADITTGNFRYQYSPESFTGTEPEFAVEVCNAVLDVWKPTKDKKAIINLPATVQHSMPHVFANQVEYFCENINFRDCITISLHPHNDRGTSVADCEMGLIAGANRVEGTLFGNGERTGNCDIVTVAMNLLSHGINPKLDFSNIDRTIKVYEKATNMKVHPRSPYAGELVFTAFSGSHQDAIDKGMKYKKENKTEIWDIPYLPVDPSDIGRDYQTCVIRLNSQCGKGAIRNVLERYSLSKNAEICNQICQKVKEISSTQNRELKPIEVLHIAKKLMKQSRIIRSHFHNRHIKHTICRNLD